MSNQSEENARFVTCRCQHCNWAIEFDPSALPEGGQVVECPHCQAKTRLRVPQPETTQIPPPPKTSNDGMTVKGAILDYSVQTNTGVISGDDARRYQFEGVEWKVTGAFPMPGIRVEFVPKANKATAIYNIDGIKPSHQPERKCNHVIAAMTAIFLGGLGIHKFYMGYTMRCSPFVLPVEAFFILMFFGLFTTPFEPEGTGGPQPLPVPSRLFS